MMNYSIRELDAFSVIGQEVELTNYQKRNIQISTQFWRKFNSNLKKSYLSQSGNWVKYAFMERRNGKLYYFCSIPKRTIIPDNFLYKEIPSYKYLVMEHIGAMEKIYETYGKIYQEIIPNTPYTPIKNITNTIILNIVKVLLYCIIFCISIKVFKLILLLSAKAFTSVYCVNV